MAWRVEELQRALDENAAHLKALRERASKLFEDDYRETYAELSAERRRLIDKINDVCLGAPAGAL